MQKTNVQKLAYAALLIAAQIVLSRFLSVQTQVFKIGFGFVPIVLAAMLFGPLWAAAVAAISDVLGAVLFPVGAYFPGFTLTAVLVALVYGFFLYREQSLVRIVAAVLVISIPLHLFLNTFWISMLYSKAYWALLLSRMLQVAVMVPVQIVLIWILANRITKGIHIKT